MAKQCYDELNRKATEDLMNFVFTLFPGENPVCVTYFDEAHELGPCFWILFYLLSAENSLTRMGMRYVFMGPILSLEY